MYIVWFTLSALVLGDADGSFVKVSLTYELSVW